MKNGSTTKGIFEHKTWRNPLDLSMGVKDYHDVWLLLMGGYHREAVLEQALKRTFGQRNTKLNLAQLIDDIERYGRAKDRQLLAKTSPGWPIWDGATGTSSCMPGYFAGAEISICKQQLISNQLCFGATKKLRNFHELEPRNKRLFYLSVAWHISLALKGLWRRRESNSIFINKPE